MYVMVDVCLLRCTDVFNIYNIEGNNLHMYITMSIELPIIKAAAHPAQARGASVVRLKQSARVCIRRQLCLVQYKLHSTIVVF